MEVEVKGGLRRRFKRWYCGVILVSPEAELPTPACTPPGAPSLPLTAPLLQQSQVIRPFSSGLSFIMGVPAGVPGFLMLPGRAGGGGTGHISLHKEQLACPFVQPKLSLDPQEHPSRGAPHPCWTAELPSVKRIEIGK